MNHKFFFFLFSLMLLTGCGSEQSQAQDSQQASDSISPTSAAQVHEEHKDASQMTLRGQIMYLDFEGGFYGFVSEDGKNYTLQGLAPEYQKHGMTVEMQASLVTGMMTTTQFGDLLKVHNITVLAQPKGPAPSDNTM
ncbi:hypothetical protein KJ365_09020 [Glaciecola sp. XM2]|jgi:hypothetical protein|uniref:hypothetical protein n=1 Tax=Glaciecola sp. XM2 TaxID=1914931 RepID=UPI001BDE94AA|nr:hypothetical protein [Glaciecola sp. XM2]MBT1451018.1 hypothetical protein [Glaciecola sp. XM2]